MRASIIAVRAVRCVALFSAVLLVACGGGGGYDGGDPAPPAPPPPPPGPTVTISGPTTFAANRTVTLTANVTAPAGVALVEFLVDGAVVGSATVSPYAFDWDTSTVSDGPHEIAARVTDAANAVVTSTPVAVAVNNHPTIHVVLSPTETFPLPQSTASGEGDLTFDLLTGAVTGGVTVTGIAATLAHIHRAYAGDAGPVIVDFVQNAADPNRWEPVQGGALTAEQIADLLAGRLYVNVHSAAYPLGEIRGQLRPENIDVAFATLDGASVSPPVTTAASGAAAVTLDASAATATVYVNVVGADDATEAHVHKAEAGANNATPLITLVKDIAAPGSWAAELQPITAVDRTDFDNNGWYVDVHTPANPGGELRGQFTPNPPGPPPPPPAATLTQIQGAIFTPVCSVCHNGVGGVLPGSMNLSTAGASFAALVNVPSEQQPGVLRVAPGNPDASYLIHKLEGAPTIFGSRMPQGGPFLDQVTIDQVRSWISAGAQNN